MLRDPFDICNESMTYVSDDFIAGIYKYKYKYIDIYIKVYSDNKENGKMEMENRNVKMTPKRIPNQY